VRNGSGGTFGPHGRRWRRRVPVAHATGRTRHCVGTAAPGTLGPPSPDTSRSRCQKPEPLVRPTTSSRRPSFSAPKSGEHFQTPPPVGTGAGAPETAKEDARRQPGSSRDSKARAGPFQLPRRGALARRRWPPRLCVSRGGQGAWTAWGEDGGKGVGAGVGQGVECGRCRTILGRHASQSGARHERAAPSPSWRSARSSSRRRDRDRAVEGGPSLWRAHAVCVRRCVRRYSAPALAPPFGARYLALVIHVPIEGAYRRRACHVSAL